MSATPATQAFDADQLWAAIDDQRVRTADLLAELTDAEWDEPSLCDGWTVRDVAAHLTAQQETVGSTVAFALRHPGVLSTDLNRTINRSARALAAELPREEIIRRIRAMVGSRRHNSFITPLEALTDALVHGQDIAVPLGRPLAMDPRAAAVAAARRWDTRATWMARVNRSLPLDGLRFRATDAAWAAGEGAEIAGPIAALLLLITGRPALVAELTGEGAEILKARLP